MCTCLHIRYIRYMLILQSDTIVGVVHGALTYNAAQAAQALRPIAHVAPLTTDHLDSGQVGGGKLALAWLRSTW